MIEYNPNYSKYINIYYIRIVLPPFKKSWVNYAFLGNILADSNL